MMGANQPNGIERIAKERMRQIEEEGWDREHDAEHTAGQLARIAALYAIPSEGREVQIRPLAGPVVSLWQYLYPFSWSFSWWKPSPENRIRELEKAGALIAAEIDRLIAEEANET